MRLYLKGTLCLRCLPFISLKVETKPFTASDIPKDLCNLPFSKFLSAMAIIVLKKSEEWVQKSMLILTLSHLHIPRAEIDS